MPSGSLFSDGSSANSGHDSASAAKKAFPDSPPSAIEPCPTPTPGKKKKGPKTCTLKEAKAKLDSCDGSTGVYANAKNKSGKTPTYKYGSSVIGTGASVDTTTGVITIDKGQSCCRVIDLMVMELTNLGHKPDFNKLHGADCSAGVYNREGFIKANERLEYDGVKNALKAFDACKSKWGCTKSSFEFGRAKNFESYYKRIANKHKEYWGGVWDRNCKSAYEKKHPPAAKKTAKTAAKTTAKTAAKTTAKKTAKKAAKKSP